MRFVATKESQDRHSIIGGKDSGINPGNSLFPYWLIPRLLQSANRIIPLAMIFFWSWYTLMVPGLGLKEILTLTIFVHLFAFWVKVMFHLHNSLKYYLYPLPVDMRKSFYTLSGIVNSFMNQSVRDGGVFIFVNRNQNVMKILHMEYAGLVIYHKRLESGRFKLPGFDENTTSLTINWQDLMTMVQSVKIRKVKSRKIVNKNLLFS